MLYLNNDQVYKVNFCIKCLNPLQKIALYRGFTLLSAIFNSHYTGDRTNWNRTNRGPSVFWEGRNIYLFFIHIFIFQVLIDSDAAYLIFMIIFSISNGYIGSVVMMFGPKMLQSGEDQGRAASLLVSFLVTGLAAGAFMSQLVVNLL